MLMENQNVATKKVTAATPKKNEAMTRQDDGFGFLRPLFGLFDDDYFDNEATNAYGMMKTDITDNGNAYNLAIEVPGIKKDAIKISLDKGYLTVSYKIDETQKEGTGKKVHTERRQGFYRRDFFVGYDVKKDAISASLADGILTVTVPKEAEKDEAAKMIDIK
jgi:HSP20 family protein